MGHSYKKSEWIKVNQKQQETNMIKKTIISICISTAILSGCGSDNKDNIAPVSSDLIIDSKQSLIITDTLIGNDEDSAVTFSIVDPDSVKLGKLVITDPAKGTFTYTTEATEGVEVVKFKVSDGYHSSISQLTINIDGGDPLYTQQWHLNNTGQNSFSLGRGIAGNDINVEDAISNGITGKGVVVAVIDNGVDISHPDLKNNIAQGGSLNLITGTTNPTPFDDDASHGTAVAGIIAAEGWNGLGGRGVAPNANIIGFNYLDIDPVLEAKCKLSEMAEKDICKKGTQTFNNFARSHGNSSYSDIARVFNQSYGYVPPYPEKLSDNENENDVYANVSNNSAGGLGSIFVKSAGNSFSYYTTGEAFWAPSIRSLLGLPDNHGIPFHNSNMSSDNTNLYNLVVSAMNADGKRSSYSSVGSNVFVTAPGGEYGLNKPAIVTTDRPGCDKGSSKLNDRPKTPFDGGEHPLNLECDYVSTMNGTSSAAPNISGAIAMIMSANLSLTWRDVRNILAKTSKVIDADIKPIEMAVGEGDKAPKFTAVPAWIKNAAGFNFHDFYGFGLVDVSKAVEEAKNYKDDLGEYVVTDWNKKKDINKTVPDGDLTGLLDLIEIDENLIIEGVQVTLTIDHKRLPDLAIELISPSGTKSVLMTPYNGFVYQGFNNDDEAIKGYDDTPMLSNAFYGEKSLGEWKLKVTDVNSGNYSFFTTYQGGTQSNPEGTITIPNEDNGMLKSWSIRFHGHVAK